MPALTTYANMLKINPGAGKFLAAGIGVLAAAAIVISWGSDIDDLKIGAIYIIVFAFIVSILMVIRSDKMMRTVISWILIAAFGAWVLGLVGSVFNLPNSLPSTACYLRLPMMTPRQCEAELGGGADDLQIGQLENQPAARGAFGIMPRQSQIWTVQEALSMPVPTQQSGLVYLQFANPVTRPDIIALADELVGLNWQVQGAEDGGEQVKEGPEGNEVRYFKDSDREAAIELARTLHSLHPEQPVTVRNFTRLGSYVREGTLEIWLVEFAATPQIEG